MKKNKKLYKLVIVLVVLLCVCLIINFTHNKMINDNTEIIDIECEGENCEKDTIPKDTDDNKNNANDDVTNNPQTDNASNNSGTGNGNSGTENNNSGTNGTGNSSGNGSTTGTEPVVTNGDGDTIIPDENGEIEEAKNKLSVSDSYQTWTNITEIRIFDVDQIAPGDSGTYDFVVNNNTDENVDYGIVFEENNVANVNMLYKLKRNNEYIAGDETTWVKYNELNFDNKILNENNIDAYNIEWKWVPAENDTAAGRLHGAKYGLNVTVKAAETEEFEKYSKATLNPLTGDKILQYIEIALLSMIVLVLLTIKRRQKD